MPPAPRDAATLILARRGRRPRHPFEVLMLRRSAGSAFLPGYYVFPGGAVEDSDFQPEVEHLCRGLSFSQAYGIISDATPPERSLGFFVAALREAFEETGILPAYEGLAEGGMARMGQFRPDVQADPSRFARRLKEESISLATDRLSYFAHWITPEASPIRFSARFFMAEAPADQEATPDGKEILEVEWVSPGEALDRFRQGRWGLAPPTLESLLELDGASSIEEALSAVSRTRGNARYG